MPPAKTTERKLAFIYFVDKGMDQKEIAELLDVSPNTVSRWAIEDGWEKLRNAKMTGPDALLMHLNELQTELVEQRIQMQRDGSPASDRRGLTDEISKVTKAIEAARRDKGISLRTYIAAMEMLQADMLANDQELFHKLVAYQEKSIFRIANKLEEK